MRKLKFWLILQSLILGLEIALKTCHQRKRQRYYVQYFYRRGGGHEQLIYTEEDYRSLRVDLCSVLDHRLIASWYGFGLVGQFFSVALLYIFSLSVWLTYYEPKIFLFNRKMQWDVYLCYFFLSWLTLAKQLSRRLSKSSVTLPPYWTSPIMYRTVFHDTPFIKK